MTVFLAAAARRLPRVMPTTRLFSSNSAVGQNVAMAKQALINCDAVCFDVDSTVIQEEGIDLIGEMSGHPAMGAFLDQGYQVITL